MKDDSAANGDSLASQATLLSLLERSPDAVLAHRDGVIFFCNKAASDMFGAESPQAMVGLRALELIHPEMRDLVKERTLAGAGHAGRWPVEQRRLVRRDGEEFPGEVSATALPGEDALTLLVIIRDISARTRTEEALKASEANLRAVMEAAGDAMFISNAEHHFVEVNEQACRSLGYTRDELLSLTIDDIEVGLSQEERSRAFQAIIQDVSMTMNGVQRRKDGSTFPVEVRGTLIERGGERFALSLTRDVTQRRRDEEALRLSEEQFRQSFEAAHIGMAIVDLDHHIARINGAFADMLGYGRDELIGKEFADITHPDDRVPSVELWARLTGGGEDALHLEKRYLRKDGDVVWGSLNCALVRDEEGEPLHIVSQVEDITRRKRIEEEIIAATREAAKANESKSEFLAGMSHELRTPLNAILGFSEALEGEIFGPLADERQREYLRHIHASGTKLAELIDTLFEQVENPNSAAGAADEEAPEEEAIPEPAPGGKRHVLAIDDEPTLLTWISDALTSFGYDVTTCQYSAADCPDFVNLLESGGPAPDVILSDYRLPGNETGIDVVKQLRDLYDREVPVLLLTGDVTGATWDAAQAQGFELLVKPVRLKELRAAVSDILGAD